MMVFSLGRIDMAITTEERLMTELQENDLEMDPTTEERLLAEIEECY